MECEDGCALVSSWYARKSAFRDSILSEYIGMCCVCDMVLVPYRSACICVCVVEISEHIWLNQLRHFKCLIQHSSELVYTVMFHELLCVVHFIDTVILQ